MIKNDHFLVQIPYKINQKSTKNGRFLKQIASKRVKKVRALGVLLKT